MSGPQDDPDYASMSDGDLQKEYWRLLGRLGDIDADAKEIREKLNYAVDDPDALAPIKKETDELRRKLGKIEWIAGERRARRISSN